MPEHHREYVRTWLVTALCIVGVVAGINLLVDPFRMYGLVEIDGFNSIKVRAGQRGALSKTYEIERIKPQSLVLGNSRAEIGLDPDHPGWPAQARPVYNLALPGAGLAASLGQLDLALTTSRIKTVVAGLEFRDFTSDAAKATLASGRQANPGSEASAFSGWAKRLHDYSETLLSLGALGDSIRTVLGQHDAYPPSVTKLGFNPLLDYVPIAKEWGYRALFDQRNADNARAFLKGGKDIFLPGSRNSPDFQALRTLLRRCRDSGAHLHLVVYPYHAETLELFRAADLWNAFEDWKRTIALIVDEEAIQSGSARPFPLWDFSGYTSVTTERVPQRGDRRTEMRWYWEAGHFKKETGDLVLDRVFNHAEPGRVVPDDFGKLLTPASIENHLAQIRTVRERYVREHPPEIAELARIVARVKN